MDLYHSRLTSDDLNDLIIKYKIPHDLHPQLPLEEFVMFELPDDAIVWKEPFCDPVFGVPIVIRCFGVPMEMLWASLYYTPPATADAVIPNPTPEDLATDTPSSKILVKAEASQKRKASTSGAASSHVAKHTSDDDDACVEIPLVTPLRSAVVIPSSGNQGGSSVAPTAEGSNTRDSRGKGIMIDDVAAPSGGVSRQRPSSGPAPSFRDVFGDSIHTDFFPFSAGPYYATYPEDGVAGN
ncbi:hypothetical protein Tco_1384592, partial [Tanacetum coccineum]